MKHLQYIAAFFNYWMVIFKDADYRHKLLAITCFSLTNLAKSLLSLHRRIMALEEDKTSGNWKERSVCMGDTKTCSFPGLINHHHKFIISFGEDEAGNVCPKTSSLTGLQFCTRVMPLMSCTSFYFVYFFCLLFFQGSFIFSPPPTQAPFLLLEQFSNSWIRPGRVRLTV